MSEKQDNGMLTVQSSSSYFLWKVPNFCASCKNIGDFIESPTFTNSFSKQDPWKLRLFPRGVTVCSKDWLALYVEYRGGGIIAYNIKLSLLDDKYMKVKEANMGETITRQTNPTEIMWGYDEFIARQYIMDRKNRVLEDDKLKILCEVTFKPEFVALMLAGANSKNHDTTQVSTYRLQTFDDLEKLFESELHSDVTIIVGKNNFHTHKAILASRSPVFEAMFKHEMKEKRDNVIEITDVSYEVMKEVLRFIYASKVINIENITSNLLVAAEKYSVEGLKTLCEETLYDNLNIENAIEYLKLSDMCNAAKLKLKVIEFIVQNQKAVTEKPEFDLFGDLHSRVQCELVRALVAENSS